jgi:hypothetical protein
MVQHLSPTAPNGNYNRNYLVHFRTKDGNDWEVVTNVKKGDPPEIVVPVDQGYTPILHMYDIHMTILYIRRLTPYDKKCEQKALDAKLPPEFCVCKK